MSEYHKKKKFLNLPQYPGGKKAFIEFIKNNLRYPQQALDAKIEGRVLVEFEIDDNGTVHNPWIKKSLGYGCDEEALRVVGLLQYGCACALPTKHLSISSFPKPPYLIP